MKPSTSLFLVAALIIVSPVDHLAADDQVILWTPTELVAKGGDKLWDNVTEFVVQFRVASVRSVPTIFPDGDKRQVPHLVPAAEGGCIPNGIGSHWLRDNLDFPYFIEISRPTHPGVLQSKTNRQTKGCWRRRGARSASLWPPGAARRTQVVRRIGRVSWPSPV